MTLQLLHSKFPYIWGKFYFLFYQCRIGFKCSAQRSEAVHWKLLRRLIQSVSRSSGGWITGTAQPWAEYIQRGPPFFPVVLTDSTNPDSPPHTYHSRVICLRHIFINLSSLCAEGGPGGGGGARSIEGNMSLSSIVFFQHELSYSVICSADCEKNSSYWSS